MDYDAHGVVLATRNIANASRRQRGDDDDEHLFSELRSALRRHKLQQSADSCGLDVPDKSDVCSFLADFASKRKIYRKQVREVRDILQTNTSWQIALEDCLDLQRALDDRANQDEDQRRRREIAERRLREQEKAAQLHARQVAVRDARGKPRAVSLTRGSLRDSPRSSPIDQPQTDGYIRAHSSDARASQTSGFGFDFGLGMFASSTEETKSPGGLAYMSMNLGMPMFGFVDDESQKPGSESCLKEEESEEAPHRSATGIAPFVAENVTSLYSGDVIRDSGRPSTSEGGAFSFLADPIPSDQIVEPESGTNLEVSLGDGHNDGNRNVAFTVDQSPRQTHPEMMVSEDEIYRGSFLHSSDGIAEPIAGGATGFRPLGANFEEQAPQKSTPAWGLRSPVIPRVPIQETFHATGRLGGNSYGGQLSPNQKQPWESTQDELISPKAPGPGLGRERESYASHIGVPKLQMGAAIQEVHPTISNVPRISPVAPIPLWSAAIGPRRQAAQVGDVGGRGNMQSAIRGYPEYAQDVHDHMDRVTYYSPRPQVQAGAPQYQNVDVFVPSGAQRVYDHHPAHEVPMRAVLASPSSQVTEWEPTQRTVKVMAGQLEPDYGPLEPDYGPRGIYVLPEDGKPFKGAEFLQQDEDPETIFIPHPTWKAPKAVADKMQQAAQRRVDDDVKLKKAQMLQQRRNQKIASCWPFHPDDPVHGYRARKKQQARLEAARRKADSEALVDFSEFFDAMSEVMVW